MIYIYVYQNFKPKATCVIVNISKYKNKIIFHKYFGCFQNLLQRVWTKHLTKSLQTQQKVKTN